MDDGDVSDAPPPKKNTKAAKVASPAKPGRKSRALPESDDDEEEKKPTKVEATEPVPMEVDEPEAKPVESKEATKAEDSDESEMSVLIDEPKPKKRQKKSASEKPAKATKEKPAKATKEKSAKAVKQKTKAAKPEKELSPDEAEIKRLQGWLLKCGIRRMWFRELAPYDTPKAKINHLKDMLKDVGMDGRYSVEKAKQIKDRRELEAELDAVQEGAKRWGQEGESEQEEEGERPRRRLAKGLQELQFLDSGGEDSD